LQQPWQVNQRLQGMARCKPEELSVARLIFLAAAMLLAASHAWARCQIDQKHSLEEMSAWHQPCSSRVPRGFKIDQRKAPFAVSTLNGPIRTYSLPSDTPGQGKVLALVGSSWRTYREDAECRVEAPDGRWWLATRDVGNDLSYVLQSETETPLKH
jgi:hypothetical protein